MIEWRRSQTMDPMGMAGGAVVLAQVSMSEQWLNWFGSLFGPHALTAIAVIKIIGINIILSGDNAVVIALACRNLPPRQRKWGIMLGAGAAVVLRIIFTLLVQFLFNLPWLKLAGGLLLLWIAIKLLAGEDHADDDGKVAGGSSLWEAVKIVAIADIVMSLDNVLAIAGAAEAAPPEQRIWLIIMGLVISIPLVVAGSTLIMGLLSRYPILVWAGAGLLGWIAGELIATEPILQDWVASLSTNLGVSAKFILRSFEIIGVLIVLVVGWIVTRWSARAASNQHPAE
jgi:YjbE family integral membrane protein